LGLSGYSEKLKQDLIEKDLVIQEETRKGLKGRLAKVLALTDKGFSVLKRLPAGKGGDAHKYLQMMLKEQAEVLGWKATVEEKLSHSLKSVDVGLKKGDIRVAIEVASFSKPEQEIANIRKCLEASYDYVVSVSDDKKFLEAIKALARKVFTFKEKERIRFYLPREVKELLGIVSEKAIVSGQIHKEKQLLNTKDRIFRHKQKYTL